MTGTGRALLLAVLALGPAACAGTGGGAHDQALDGRRYAVSLTPEGQSAMPDDLIFQNGTFESTVCTRAGFAKTTYATRLVAGGIAFDAQCDSPEFGHNDWHGVVAGDHVSGVVVRTPKNGGAPVKSAFSGDVAR